MRFRLNNALRERSEDIRWFYAAELVLPPTAVLRDCGEFKNLALCLPGEPAEYLIGYDELGATILLRLHRAENHRPERTCNWPGWGETPRA